MFLLNDDPIISSIERSGYPSWFYAEIHEEEEVEAYDEDDEEA